MSDVSETESMPWFLKVIIFIAGLVVLFIIGIDLLTFAGAL